MYVVRKSFYFEFIDSGSRRNLWIETSSRVLPVDSHVDSHIFLHIHPLFESPFSSNTIRSRKIRDFNLLFKEKTY